MPDVDWKKIKAEYIRTEVSYRKLAQKYGVPPSTLARRMSQEKWADLRRQSNSKAIARIVETVAIKEASKVDKIQSIADMLLDKIAEKIADGSYTVESKDMRAVTSALKDIIDIKGYKSDLDIQEQLARIEKLRKDTSDEKETEIRVVIDSGLDEFSK